MPSTKTGVLVAVSYEVVKVLLVRSTIHLYTLNPVGGLHEPSGGFQPSRTGPGIPNTTAQGSEAPNGMYDAYPVDLLL